MARSLVIVESPAKAKTINRYLGKDFIVKSSVGHIRDLPVGAKAVDPKARAKEAQKTKALSPEKKAAYKKKRSREQLVRRMGVNPDKEWSAEYEILPGKEKVVEELQVKKIEYVKETNAHHEYRGRPLPAYAIHFDHPEELVAYVDAKSGQFQRIRHQSWRWFDFLWMSHTMDYQGRDDFNNILLRIFSLFGLFTVLSGFLLWGTSSSTVRTLFKKSK